MHILGQTLQELIIHCTSHGSEILACLRVLPNLRRLSIKTSINLKTPVPLLSHLTNSDYSICPKLQYLEYEGSELDLNPNLLSELLKTRWVNADNKDRCSRLNCLVLRNIKLGPYYPLNSGIALAEYDNPIHCRQWNQEALEIWKKQFVPFFEVDSVLQQCFKEGFALYVSFGKEVFLY